MTFVGDHTDVIFWSVVGAFLTLFVVVKFLDARRGVTLFDATLPRRPLLKHKRGSK
jgi:hypothetical protein